MSQKTPIIVVGMNRSGTKWLSNVLCNHSDVTGVQGVNHQGIMESNMLWVMDDKFDLNYSQEYVTCVDLWTQSDFVRNSGVDPVILYQEPRPLSMLGIFVRLMEQRAINECTQYWIQKTSPESALSILPRLPSARVIVIRRNFQNTIKSSLQLAYLDGHLPSIFDAVYTFVAQSKMLTKLEQSKSNVLSINFEDLVKDKPGATRRICDHVGIQFEPEMLEQLYEKNSSFTAPKDHPAVVYVDRHQRRIKLLHMILSCFPLWFIEGYKSVKAALVGRRPRPFVFRSFSELEAEKTHSLEEVELTP